MVTSRPLLDQQREEWQFCTHVLTSIPWDRIQHNVLRTLRAIHISQVTEETWVLRAEDEPFSWHPLPQGAAVLFKGETKDWHDNDYIAGERTEPWQLVTCHPLIATTRPFPRVQIPTQQAVCIQPTGHLHNCTSKSIRHCSQHDGRWTTRTAHKPVRYVKPTAQAVCIRHNSDAQPGWSRPWLAYNRRKWSPPEQNLYQPRQRASPSDLGCQSDTPKHRSIETTKVSRHPFEWWITIQQSHWKLQ